MKKHLKKMIAIVLMAALVITSGIYYSDNLSTDVSASSSTGVGLAEHCMTAYYEGWSYVYGAMSYGAVDCSGLIMLYNGVGGIRTDMMSASPETGYISSLPNIHGLGLYQPGHVGVYVGSGMAVDARSAAYGVCYQSVYSKNWTNWFKVAGVSYPDTGWVTFNGNSFYYENGEYLTNTSRTIDGVTYTFNSAGTISSAVDGSGSSVDVSSMSGNNASYNSASSSSSSYSSYSYSSYTYDNSAAEAEAEAEAERQRQEEEERQKQEEEERQKQEEEERKKQEEEERLAAENRLAEEKQGSAIAYLTATATVDPSSQVEPETVAIQARADTMVLKSEEAEEAPVESETTVTMDKATTSTMGNIQTTEVAANRHPVMFVVILAVTVLFAFLFIMVEKRMGTRRYARSAHSRSRR